MTKTNTTAAELAAIATDWTVSDDATEFHAAPLHLEVVYAKGTGKVLAFTVRLDVEGEDEPHIFEYTATDDGKREKIEAILKHHTFNGKPPFNPKTYSIYSDNDLTDGQRFYLSQVQRAAEHVRSGLDNLAHRLHQANEAAAQGHRVKSPGYPVLGQNASDLEDAAAKVEALLEIAWTTGIPDEKTYAVYAKAVR